MVTSTFNCPRCNAPIFYPGGDDVTIECMFCGNAVIVPRELRAPPGASASAEPASLMKQLGALGDIAVLARQGNKLEAIKRYRELFDVGLAEAKDAVDKMAAGQFGEAAEDTLTAPARGEAPAFAQMNDADALERIKALAQAGQKIEAIKLYRQASGVGLKEAKDAVEAIQAGQPVTLTRATSAPLDEKSALLVSVKLLLQAGNKIEAIKVYRQATGLGLKEAKDAVEAMEAGLSDANTFDMNPSGAYQFPRADRPVVMPASRHGGMSTLMAGAIVLAAFVLLMGIAVVFFVFFLAGK
jgi:ribosomal protein L7/L12